jgi:hypothetical protein
MMICCGTIGGSLYDIRGLIKHSTKNDFDPLCTLSYLLRPIAGGLAGYSSQVFMLKLKEIADAAFSTRERDNGNGHAGARAESQAPRKVA